MNCDHDTLGPAGTALVQSIVDDLQDGWELDARELHLLQRAGRVEDELAMLQDVVDREGVVIAGSRGQTIAHPALSESRQLRLVQLRLLKNLELVDPDQRDRSASPKQRQARAAAHVRWGKRPATPKRSA